SGGGKGRNRTLHVGSATAEDEAILLMGRERWCGPILDAARRHDVDMAGKAQMRRALAEAGEEIVDIGRARLGEDETLAREARGAEKGRETIERARLIGGHRGAADKICEERQRVGSHEYQSI